MSDIVTNKRKAKCADCKRPLAPGEGQRHEMGWFGGKGNGYYLCQSCELKRYPVKAENEDPSGVLYE